jgi:hypothetical protein
LDSASYYNRVINNINGSVINFFDVTGVVNGGVIYEDLFSYNYSGTSPVAPVYVGYFTLNTANAGGPGAFTFTVVPEPGTFSLLSGAGFLALAMRRKLGHVSA